MYLYEITNEPMTDTELELYLSRLEISHPIKADLSTLKSLQWHHLTHIPYENFDSLAGHMTSLNHKELFRKLIIQRRGGICFELNGLYAWLLERIGYKIQNHAARFISKNDTVQMRRHRVMTVLIEDQRYLTDVGVNSESPRTPLLLKEASVQCDGISTYRFTRDPFWGWVLWQKPDGKPWKMVYGFTEEPQLNMDYIMPCVFCDLHPLSPINKFTKISIFTPESNVRIWDKMYTCYTAGNVTEKHAINHGEAIELLKGQFKINLDYLEADVLDYFHDQY